MPHGTCSHCYFRKEKLRVKEIRNVTSDAGIFNISRKEITIPLSDYTDLIAKEAMLDQIRHAASKDDSDYGTIGIIKAILQIDTPEDKK